VRLCSLVGQKRDWQRTNCRHAGRRYRLWSVAGLAALKGGEILAIHVYATVEVGGLIVAGCGSDVDAGR